MYRRFLNNNDYLGLITPEALAQLTRGNEERFLQAEESAEKSLVERLSENYEVEQELAKGKYIAPYDRCITYPVGVHIYYDGQIHEVIRAVSGYTAPANEPHWAVLQSGATRIEVLLPVRNLLPGRRGII